MVRKIKIVDVYTKPEANEEANDEPPPPSDEATIAQASDTEPTLEPMTEANESEHEPPPPPEPGQSPAFSRSEEPKSEEREHSSQARKPNNKMLDMPTTPKILQQVECQACKRKMSAKVLRYSHAKYCTERERERGTARGHPNPQAKHQKRRTPKRADKPTSEKPKTQA